MHHDEVLEVSHQVPAGRSGVRGRGVRRCLDAPGERTHRVVVGRQGVGGTAQEQEVDGGQEQVRPPLPHRGLADQRQDVGVVGDATADHVIGGGAVARRTLGEEAELIGEWCGTQ